MKILAISCSPRKNKTTTAGLKLALEAAKEAVPDIETELIELAGRKFNGCIACYKCYKEGSECSQQDDLIEVLDKMKDPDVKGIILGTPVYFQCMSSQAKALLDRAVILRRHGFLLRDKVGGALSIGNSRNGGQELTLQAVHAAMLCQDMIVVSDGKPTAHLGATLVNTDNSIAGDEFGSQTAKGLGKRVAETAAKLG